MSSECGLCTAGAMRDDETKERCQCGSGGGDGISVHGAPSGRSDDEAEEKVGDGLSGALLELVVRLVREGLTAKQIIASLAAFVGDDNSAAPYATVAWQDAMLHALLTDAVTLEFPVRRGAVWKLVKALIDHCDGFRAEVAQSLLDYLFESKPQAPDDPFAPETYFRSYDLRPLPTPLAGGEARVAPGKADRGEEQEGSGVDRGVVSVRVEASLSFVGNAMWRAGLYLAEVLLSFPELVEGRALAEIGAGVGMTGLALAKSDLPSRLVLTDGFPEVLLNLRFNVEVNDAADAVEVWQLEWGADPSTQGDAWEAVRACDLLLGADLVYDPEVNPLLADLLAGLLVNGGNGSGDDGDGHCPEAILLATTVRRETTFANFEALLGARGLSAEDLTETVGAGRARRYHYDDEEVLLWRIGATARGDGLTGT